jgi:plastocyanin
VKRNLFLLALWLVLLLVACTPGPGPTAKPTPTAAPTPAPTKATIQNISHENLTVTVGATVAWTNQDDVPHTVTAEDGKFKSKFLNKGQIFSFTFREAGSFKYFCEVHPDVMRATVVVTR